MSNNSTSKEPKSQNSHDSTLDDYYDSVTILHCNGDKCRIHAYDGLGFHCESCNESFYDIEHIPITIESFDSEEPRIVNCHGNKCRLDGSEGIYCEDCCGDYEYD